MNASIQHFEKKKSFVIRLEKADILSNFRFLSGGQVGIRLYLSNRRIINNIISNLIISAIIKYMKMLSLSMKLTRLIQEMRHSF